MKKVLGPILLILFIVGIAAAIYFSAREQLATLQVVTIRGLIGSEKEAFFKDPRVIETLRKANLDVHVEKAGSRQIADKIAEGGYDFVSPSGVPAAEKIRREQDVSGSYEVFFTPMAVASWKPIAEILVANGIAEAQAGYYMLDMEQFLGLIEQEKRWEDLSDNASYDVSKSILINSTDVRTSNSAAMYLSLASYVANANTVVRNDEEIANVMPLMESIFFKQGFQEQSSAVPFNDYLTMGIGKAPLVMIYESQFIYQAATGSGMQPDMVLLYPQPTIYTKHFIISMNEHGDLLGKLLRNDPELQSDPKLKSIAEELQKLAIEHGFRNNDMNYFRDFTSQHTLSVALNLVDIIEPPTYEILEGMIQRIEQHYP